MIYFCCITSALFILASKTQPYTCLSVCAVDPNTEVKDSVRSGCGGRPGPRSQEPAAHVLNHGHCCSTARVHVLANFPPY